MVSESVLPPLQLPEFEQQLEPLALLAVWSAAQPQQSAQRLACAPPTVHPPPPPRQRNHLATPEAAPSTGARELRAACEATGPAGGPSLATRASCALEGDGQQFPHPHHQMMQAEANHGRAFGRTTSAIL